MKKHKIISAIATLVFLVSTQSFAQMSGNGTATGTGPGTGSTSGSGAGTGTGIDSNTGINNPTRNGMDTGRSHLDTNLGTGPGGAGDNIGTTSGTYDDTTAPVKTQKDKGTSHRSIPNPPAGTNDTGPVPDH